MSYQTIIIKLYIIIKNSSVWILTVVDSRVDYYCLYPNYKKGNSFISRSSTWLLVNLMCHSYYHVTELLWTQYTAVVICTFLLRTINILSTEAKAFTYVGTTVNALFNF